MTDATFGGWSLDDVRAEWPDAPADDTTLQRYLQVAETECYAYAPRPSLWSKMGPNYFQSFRQAVLTHTRNIWNAAKVDPGNGSLGDDSFQIRPFPMDWAVQARLRPKRPLPWVG